jgi:AcrR family transcriptional regulator
VTAEPVTARGRRTRDALLSAARDVLAERGYDETRMSDIADAAGVSHGTVYTYFAGKDEVLRAVCDAGISEVLEAVRVPDDLRADPVVRIEEGHRRYLLAYVAHARMLEVLEQAATTDRRFRDLVESLRAVFVEKAAGTLRRFQADGIADVDLDPALAAPALVGMVEAYARRWHDHGETYDQEQVVRTLARLWAGAVGLTGPGGKGRA